MDLEARLNRDPNIASHTLTIFSIVFWMLMAISLFVLTLFLRPRKTLMNSDDMDGMQMISMNQDLS